MTKPKWILFDVGGVLLNWTASSAAARELLGVTHDELFDVLFDQTVEMNIGAKMNLGIITAEEGWAMVLKMLRKNHSPSYIINRWYAKEFWLEGSLKLSTELHRAGYKLAIMSNSWIGLTNLKKRKVFPKEIGLFDEVFDSSVERTKKPDLKFYELVEKRTSCKGNDLLLIDDEAKNLFIARKQDWQTFKYEMGSSSDGSGSNHRLRRLLLDFQDS